MDYSRSRAKDSDTTYTNSTLTADNINLSSTGDTTVKGGNVNASNTLNVDVGGDLLVQSVQNRYSANSNSAGISAGFGLGAGENAAANGKTVGGAVNNIGQSNGDVSSVSGGLNASNSRTRIKETVLTSLTGENVNINVEGHTGQVGSVIAANGEK
jgi:filamentous hemagglutinin